MSLGRYQHALWLLDKAIDRYVRRDFGAWGANTLLRTPFSVDGAERIFLGENITLHSGCVLQTHGSGRIVIGDGVISTGYTWISAAERIVIGERALLARGVSILDHEHRHEAAGVPIVEQGIHRIAPVSIGAGAWLGANVVVLPGVCIGANAVVGANSVVRDDVPDGVTVAGAPARVLRAKHLS